MTTRVLYVHHGGAIGGAPLSLLYLLQGLDRTEFEPEVIALRDGPAVDLYRAEGIPTSVCEDIADFSHTELEWYGGREGLWRLPARMAAFPASVRAARAQIRARRPDLVHVNSSTLAAVARAARLEGVPVVWHVREPIVRGYLGLRRWWLTRAIARDATRVIAISQFDASRLRSPAKVHVIHNCVDLARFRPASASRGDGTSGRAPVVAMVGGSSRSKGTLTFIGAIDAVRRRVPDAHFVVAGRRPEVPPRPRVRRAGRWLAGIDRYDGEVASAATRWVDQGVLRFEGVVVDMPALLASVDVLVFPATVPHFGRPIVEAAAMAIPVVASDLGPARELVDDGRTGILVPPADTSTLGNAVAELLADPNRARAMGNTALVRARAMFSAEANVAATVSVYREILG